MATNIPENLSRFLDNLAEFKDQVEYWSDKQLEFPRLPPDQKASVKSCKARFVSSLNRLEENLLAVGTMDEQAENIFLMWDLAVHSYLIGIRQGAYSPGIGNTTPISEHLEKARATIRPLNKIKREVVKDVVEKIWSSNPALVGNARGTALLIMERVNEQIAARCKDEDVRFPGEKIRLGAVIDWIEKIEAGDTDEND